MFYLRRTKKQKRDAQGDVVMPVEGQQRDLGKINCIEKVQAGGNSLADRITILSDWEVLPNIVNDFEEEQLFDDVLSDISDIFSEALPDPMPTINAMEIDPKFLGQTQRSLIPVDIGIDSCAAVTCWP